MESTSNEFTNSDSDSNRSRSKTPRLFIREMVMRNFKSYAGEQRVGPFHKVSDLSLNHFSRVFSYANVWIFNNAYVFRNSNLNF